MNAKNGQAISRKQPFVSLIMPVRNEVDFIETSLKSILGQSYPNDRFEVIIADGNSSDGTMDVVRRFQESNEVSVIVINNPGLIAPTGLNCALENATGDIIIRVDGHCEIDEHYVENCVALLSSNRADGVGGPIETVGQTPLSGAIAAAMSSTFGVGNSAFRTTNDREIYTDTVAFPGYTREIIEKAGAFNEELVRNQDDEYNYRIRGLGGRILLSPTIRSRYFSRSTFKSLWRQYFQYGYWKIRVLQMHPRQMSLRQFVPFIFVVSIILTAIFSIVTSYGKWGLIAVVGGYLLANFSASIMAARTMYMIPFLSLSFAILHVSYGSGFLLGLISFSGKWRKGKADKVFVSQP